MNKLTQNILRRICKRLVVQGPQHRNNIVAYFRIMREAVENEFTEDNAPTREAFLQECLEASRK